ncbi:MAG: hypothetical protein HC819_16990 [Cyclobacteriaceae bacterium]|nr:hypothetical protein [Cyclobacteriaceae bacterium]
MIKLFLLTLLVNLFAWAPNSSEDVMLNHEMDMVNAVFTAYKDYKYNDHESFTSKLQKNGFALSKSIQETTQRNVTIDTLVFENSESFCHVFVRSIDLDYIKNISGSVILKSERPAYLAKKFTDKLKESNMLVSIEYNEQQTKYTIKDNTSFIVFDDRWKEEVSTEFSSLYTCNVEVIGSYVDISIEEIVPKRYMVLDGFMKGEKRQLKGF